MAARRRTGPSNWKAPSISGGRVNRSVLSPQVRVNSYCEIDSSIVLHGAIIGRYSRIRRAIIGSEVRVPENSVIGEDLAADLAAGYDITHERGYRDTFRGSAASHVPA